MKMNSKITNVLFFAAGAAIGSVATWKILKNRYERIVQEEIDSVKNAFNELVAIRPDQETEETTDEEEGDPNSSSGAAGKIDWSKLEDLDEDEDDEYDYEPNEEDIAEYEQLTASYSNEKGGVNKVNKKEPEEHGSSGFYMSVSYWGRVRSPSLIQPILRRISQKI